MAPTYSPCVMVPLVLRQSVCIGSCINRNSRVSARPFVVLISLGPQHACPALTFDLRLVTSG